MMVSAEEGVSILPDDRVDELLHADNPPDFYPPGGGGRGGGDHRRLAAGQSEPRPDPDCLSVLHADLDAGRC